VVLAELVEQTTSINKVTMGGHRALVLTMLLAAAVVVDTIIIFPLVQA
jgi:hypothetical protein